MDERTDIRGFYGINVTQEKVTAMTTKRSLRVLGCLLLVTAAMVLQGCPEDLVIELVFIADDNLEKAVRREVGKRFGFLDSMDMLQLRDLDARNLGIRDLAGLEYALNLLTIDVSNDRSPDVGIADLTPIQGLTSINFLNLANNDVTNLTPIEGMRSLDILALEGNNIYDLQPLITLATFGTLKSVSLSREPLEEGGVLSSSAAEQRARLQSLGVTVTLVEGHTIVTAR